MARSRGQKLNVHQLVDDEGALSAPRLSEALKGNPVEPWAEKALKPLARQDPSSIITWEENRYPLTLRNLDDPPAALFFKGASRTLWSEQIAIVGSRSASEHGRHLASRFAEELSHTHTITSGLAYGIDKQAHLACVRRGRPTVAVLACGLDQVYPREHRTLADDILNHGGTLVSEHPPGAQPKHFHFPHRNRIIAGLSLGTLVVQACERSGSISTASHTLNQGKSVFAIPGAIDDPLHAGNNRLIQDGAYLVTCPEEICQHFGLQCRGEPTTLSDEERAFLGHFDKTSLSYETLLQKTQLTASQLSSMLSGLEARGLLFETLYGYTKSIP